MDPRPPAEIASQLDTTDEMIKHALDDFGSPSLMDTGEPHLRHLLRANQAAGCCAGGHNGRPHPDLEPLVEYSHSSHPDQGAHRLSIPEMIRNIICVVAMLAMLFGMLMIPEAG